LMECAFSSKDATDVSATTLENKTNGIWRHTVSMMQTGYLRNFFMYRGSDERRSPEMPSAWWPIHYLTEPSELHGKKNVPCTNNWFTNISIINEVTKEPKFMHIRHRLVYTFIYSRFH
jgi:hypothetical protein